MSVNMTNRIERVMRAMGNSKIDTLLLTPSSGLKYVLGQGPIVDERLFVLALSPHSEPFILANRLYAAEVSDIFDGNQIFWSDGEDPIPF